MRAWAALAAALAVGALGGVALRRRRRSAHPTPTQQTANPYRRFYPHPPRCLKAGAPKTTQGRETDGTVFIQLQ
ncbi:MAG TPA: hypothetical protein H9883_00565 [Candidatus Ruthenibacterium merdigallinarum]|nr:hypothetical protein [Candidatus Ruthenibacterium merdigallinarum]